MTWNDLQERKKAYSFELEREYVKEHGKYHYGEVVNRKCFKNGKLLYKDPLCVYDVMINNDGNIKGYFLHFITKTGRISKKCFYFVPDFDEKPFKVGKNKYKVKVEHYLDTLDDYKQKHIK